MCTNNISISRAYNFFGKKPSIKKIAEGSSSLKTKVYNTNNNNNKMWPIPTTGS